MFAESVTSMASRSMPIPQPPVGGMPYSMARRKSSSMAWASPSPRRCISTCSSNRRRWSIGSFSSENALANSLPQMNSSNRSVRSGLSGCRLARGDISTGYSVMKVGFCRRSCTKRSKSPSIIFPRPNSAFTSRPRSAHTAASSPAGIPATSIPAYSRRASSMDSRGQGGVRSMDRPWYAWSSVPFTSWKTRTKRRSTRSMTYR